MRTFVLTLTWLAVTGAAAGILARLVLGDDRSALTPGQMSYAHYQIELACDACHTAGEGVRQQACLGCHERELEHKADSHPLARFADPRNADLVARIDARRCVTCHEEHQPEQTRRMAVTRPPEQCEHCHADVGDELASHAELPFDGCGDVGCHNFHDNRVLNRDYLAGRAGEPRTLPAPAVPPRGPPPGPVADASPLAASDHDAPAAHAPAGAIGEWEASAHARAGVNCTGCHGPRADWIARPGREACSACHAREVRGFEGGHHGMRLAAGLEPMRPEDARLPMARGARGRELSCTSCHGDHRFDTRRAAVTACLGCHRDDHSLAYEGSVHHDLWQREIAGRAAPGTGVSCATCHLPRRRAYVDGIPAVVVEHDQSATMRPREAMVRPACAHCHGAPFSLSALADDALVDDNFRGDPTPPPLTSFEMFDGDDP